MSAAVRKCTRCGVTKALEAFGKHSKTRLGVTEQCKPCRRESRRPSDKSCRVRNVESIQKSSREWSQRDRADNPQRSLDIVHRYTRNQALRSLPTATNWGKEWTGPELEFIARDDYSPLEAALLIGRTSAAVRVMRQKLLIDPRKARLAGVRIEAAK